MLLVVNSVTTSKSDYFDIAITCFPLILQYKLLYTKLKVTIIKVSIKIMLVCLQIYSFRSNSCARMKMKKFFIENLIIFKDMIIIENYLKSHNDEIGTIMSWNVKKNYRY